MLVFWMNENVSEFLIIFSFGLGCWRWPCQPNLWLEVCDLITNLREQKKLKITNLFMIDQFHTWIDFPEIISAADVTPTMLLTLWYQQPKPLCP